MKIRLLCLALALVGMLAVPSAAAQNKPAEIQLSIDWAHREMTLPESGRDDMPVVVKIKYQGFYCAQPQKILVPLKLDTFAKWAGASLEPKEISFTISAMTGGPTGEGTAPDATTKLNMVWDIESAPKVGARQDYFVSFESIRKVDAQTPVNCAPDPVGKGQKSPAMTAILPDRVDNSNSTSAPVGCDVDPFQAACQTATLAPKQNSPGLDVFVVLIGISIVVAYGRRRA